MITFQLGMSGLAQNNDYAAATQGKACSVLMRDGKFCGRRLIVPVVDGVSYCLMHAPEKDEAAFQREFERIIDEAGTGVADFTRFVFPSAKYTFREFKAHCVFFRAVFAGDADFGWVTFKQEVDFDRATFEKKADFVSATFGQNAGFGVAKFTERALFRWAKFRGDADFSWAIFRQVAYFGEARFFDTAKFVETSFLQEGDRFPGPVFSHAEFSRPEAILFHRTYLGQALFHSCDVSKLNFSSVEWRERMKGGKCMLFEEVVILEDQNAAVQTLKLRNGPEERNYRLIAELYQQLKKNYDERKDYWTAGDFHYGEMEMKRLHCKRKSHLVRWLYRNLGLVAWYKYASEYGESYIRPFAALLIVLAILTVLFPWAGLDRNANKQDSAASVQQQVPPPATISELSYKHFNNFVKAYPGRKWIAPTAFFGNSLMTVLSVAGFQKELKYEPSYPWGRALALLELLLTSTLIALFLLAVRRKFKR